LAYSFGGSSSWSVDPLFGARGLAAPVWQKQKKERRDQGPTTPWRHAPSDLINSWLAPPPEVPTISE
jgi:hypothetical protein